MIEQLLSAEDIIQLDPIEILGSRSPLAPTIIRTPIDEIDVCIINVFSPRGAIFWSFGTYVKVERDSDKLASAVKKQGLVFLKRLQRRASLKKKSVSVYELFYPLVAGEGLEFYPYEKIHFDPYALLGQRHFSMVIRKKDYSKCLGYFSEQLGRFDKDCFRFAVEEKNFVLMGQDELMKGFSLLCKHPVKMSEQERICVVGELRKVDWIRCVDPELAMLSGCRGGVNIALPVLCEGKLWADMVFIALKRVDAAFTICCLRQLERLPHQMDGVGWSVLSDKRAEAVERIGKELKRIPVWR